MQHCSRWIGVIFLAVIGQNVHAEPDSLAAEPPCMCSADRVALSANDSTVLQFRYTKETARNNPAWHVDIGTISLKEAGETSWYIGPAEPGVYYARAMINNNLLCSVRVVVSSRALILRGEKRITGKSFLVGKNVEQQGFGLYSYLLMRRPSDSDQEKYCRIIAAVLKLNDIEALSEYIPQKELNTFLIMVNEKVPQYYLSMKEQDAFLNAGRWVLNNYNYTRAEMILNKIDNNTLSGPYIISVRNPEDLDHLSSERHLFQNLTLLPDYLVDSWIRDFLNQAQQERFWDTATFQSFVFRMRVLIGRLAESVESVEAAGKQLLDWRKQIIELR